MYSIDDCKRYHEPTTGVVPNPCFAARLQTLPKRASPTYDPQFQGLCPAGLLIYIYRWMIRQEDFKLSWPDQPEHRISTLDFKHTL